jgi:hypothetical protein
VSLRGAKRRSNLLIFPKREGNRQDLQDFSGLTGFEFFIYCRQSTMKKSIGLAMEEPIENESQSSPLQRASNISRGIHPPA